MTIIHQCSQCGYQGRVVELADRYLCESCYVLYQNALQDDEQCANCDAEGPVFPTPEGGYCELCYEKVVSAACEERDSDA